MATCDLLGDALKSDGGLGVVLIKDSLQMSATFVVHALLRTALQKQDQKVRVLWYGALGWGKALSHTSTLRFICMAA